MQLKGYIKQWKMLKNIKIPTKKSDKYINNYCSEDSFIKLESTDIPYTMLDSDKYNNIVTHIIYNT